MLSKKTLNLYLNPDLNEYKKYSDFKSYKKSLLTESPRQKYLEKHFGCNFDENDIITLIPFKDLPPMKIKYLTVLTNNQISHCFDTIPFYNYILKRIKEKKYPKNLFTNINLTEKELLTVFKNIKYFTKEKTLNDINEVNLQKFNEIIDPYINIDKPELTLLSSDKLEKKNELLKKYNAELKTYNKKLKNKDKEYIIKSKNSSPISLNRSLNELKLNKSLKISKKSFNSENKIDKIKEKYKNIYLLYWIDINKLNWDNLSENPNAINLLNKNFDKINWNRLSKNINPKIKNLLEKRIEYEKELSDEEYKKLSNKIDWYSLLLNPNIENFKKLLRFNKIENKWDVISKNSNAINFIKDHIKFERSLNKSEYDNLKYFEQINYDKLSENINAKDLLEERYEYEKKMDKTTYKNLDDYKKIDWSILSKNQYAIKLLYKKNKDEKILPTFLYNKLKNNEKIDWEWLSTNSNAIILLEKNIDKINPFYLLINPKSSKIILKNKIDVFDWSILSEYTNNIDFLKINLDKIDYNGLSKNKNVEIIDFLKEKILFEKINWNFLSENSNYKIVNVLKKRINFEKKLSKKEYDKLSNNERLNWYYLSKNKYLINSLKNNLNKIDWNGLSENPNIFLLS